MMERIPGEVTVRVYEASRIKSRLSLRNQLSYVKVKHNGKKCRTLSMKGGTAPRWSEEHKNILKMPVEDIQADLSIQLWNEINLLPNACIDKLEIPIEPYARQQGPPTPKWHKLNHQGSILISVNFEPAKEAAEVFKEIEHIKPKRTTDLTEIIHQKRYHDKNDHDEIIFGDSICLHALGKRWMKYGSCLRTHFQNSSKCLQLSKTFDDTSKFMIMGDQAGTKLTYGSRFQLMELQKGKPVKVGTGWFDMLPVNAQTKKPGDPVLFGDDVYLQAFYAGTGGHVLGAEGESRHVFDPTIYISPHTTKVVFSISYADGLLKEPTPSLSTSTEFKLTTYNVWMMPDKITAFADVSPKKSVRAQLIADALPESDVVIFNEAFCHVARPVLLEAMKEKGYYFESPVVGHLVGQLQAKFLDGGVVLVSKYPIETTDTMRFGGVCQGDDALADKGVTYACILKDGRRVHVFASHTQAWTNAEAVKTRQDQFRMMRNFIDEQDIPSNEPVIVAGDFNVNKLLNDKNQEYSQMCEILECEDAPAPEGDTQEASFDADNNPLAKDGPSSDGVCERLDFILSCEHHLKPVEAMSKVNPIKAKHPWKWDKKGEFVDLSDHYPVTSRFLFKYD